MSSLSSLCSFAILRRLVLGHEGHYNMSRDQFVRHCGLLNRIDQDKHAAILEQDKGGSVDLQKNENTAIATLTINNPGKMNAFTGKMMVDLYNHLNELEQWKTGKGLILAGAKGTFCSGGDLGSVHKLDKRGAATMCRFMQTITTRLFNLSLVSVAVVDGYAVGGGAELVTACDYRLVSSKAKIGFVQARMNVASGWGGGPRLVKLIGRTNALKLLISASVLDADTALEYGLVDEIITDCEQVVEHGQKWLVKNCVGNADSTKALKTIVAAASDTDLESSLDKKRDQFCKVWGSPSHKQAQVKKLKHR